MASHGFETAKELATKLAKLYSLCKQQLSAQKHYDFGGLRALKFPRVGLSRSPSDPVSKEESLIVDGLRKANMAKLTPQDWGLFEQLLWDLFPNS